MKSLKDSPDPTYTSVNLSIYAIAEVFVGVFTACLPPLRKTFDTLMREMLPTTSFNATPHATHGSHALRGDSNRSTVTRVSALRHGSDADSDHAFLGETHNCGYGLDFEILKTTRVSVAVNDKASASHRDGSWA
jgi:hypothetical protein